MVLYPVTTYSQVSFKKLPIGGTSYGFEFSPQTDVTTIGARVDYGINRDAKIYLGAAIGFIDDDELGSYGGEIPPSPGVGLGVLHIQPLGQSGVEYFLYGEFGAAFAWIVDSATDETYGNSRTFGLSGGGGILKRLKTQSDLVIIPYFGLSYRNIWLTVENTLWDYKESDSDRSFGGIVGLEIEMSPTISVIGAFGFSFDSSDTVFSIGLNFH